MSDPIALDLGEVGGHASNLALHLDVEVAGERAQLGVELLDLLLEPGDPLHARLPLASLAWPT